MAEVRISGKTFYDGKQAETELAFCHYPVVVSAGDESREFAGFPEAAEFVREALSEHEKSPDASCFR